MDDVCEDDETPFLILVENFILIIQKSIDFFQRNRRENQKKRVNVSIGVKLFLIGGVLFGLYRFSRSRLR